MKKSKLKARIRRLKQKDELRRAQVADLRKRVRALEIADMERRGVEPEVAHVDVTGFDSGGIREMKTLVTWPEYPGTAPRKDPVYTVTIPPAAPFDPTATSDPPGILAGSDSATDSIDP
jgi:hypothetical protein